MDNPYLLSLSLSKSINSSGFLVERSRPNFSIPGIFDSFIYLLIFSTWDINSSNSGPDISILISPPTGGPFLSLPKVILTPGYWSISSLNFSRISVVLIPVSYTHLRAHET